ncbi:MAG: transcription-repair coupling factor [Clostridia bacterium]|nr:transcription-repair coupling factor [Clostridia bacterium]
MKRILTDCIRTDSEYRHLLEGLIRQRTSKQPLPIVAAGLCDGAADALTVSLVTDVGGRKSGGVLMVCADEKECVRTVALLKDFGLTAAHFPPRDLTFYNVTASHEFEYERLMVLSGILVGAYDAVVTTPDAALGYTIPPARLKDEMISLYADDMLDVEDFCRRLTAAGFARVDMTEGAGQFARRGGIIDIYPPYAVYDMGDGERVGSYPVRIELFGDEIDRMCIFDPETQRFSESVAGVRMTPAREVLTDEQTLEAVRRAISVQIKKVSEEQVKDELRGELEALQHSADVSFLDKYISLIYPEKTTLTDYFSPMSLCIMRSAASAEDAFKSAVWHSEEQVKSIVESGSLEAKYAEFSAPLEKWNNFTASHTTIMLDSLVQGLSGKALGGLFGFRTKHALSTSDNDELLREELEGLSKGGYRMILMAGDETKAKNYAGMLSDSWGIKAYYINDEEIPELSRLPRGEAYVIASAPTSPFELPSPRCAIISLTMNEGSRAERKKRASRSKRDSNAQQILSYADLSEGDYVVHEAHGIGQYMGLTTMEVDGVTRDYITIQYAGSDKLFMPVEKLDKVSKYIGAHSDDGTLRLSKFGSTEWGKTKARAKATMRDIAKELIALYAERQRRPGFAFFPDDDFQRDFEAAFEFDETDAQLDAAEDIKQDMQKAVPMDRLLCGDVGYGKTEVAFRAIYKAILSGKQVALLVPTTILALQHYQSAQSRMRAFPVNIEMLSRFRKPKEQRKIIADLEKGDIDLIIGTHSLLSQNVKFKDLGLLVVDEEQRFGVAQKEKIKQRVGNIDVLSLSATPIPRTLNMAMSGIRDISLLDEAPGDRQPVQSYVLEHDDLIINDAIRRELSRGGQVFYLYNFVETISYTADRIRKVFPEANVVVAHGKMDKEQLEDIWRDMITGEIDVLVSTTIIETGVDVPNANTLIVENAHRMGLSQLHQLRGRVGRSPRRAYAYFTFPRGRALTEIAEKRLEAVREYTEFGAGFQIALRDLEIRGAGNVLGAEQHGHLDAIGYDLYIKLLNEAVLEERGEKVEEKIDTTVSLNINAYIPDSYVASASLRMSLYKKIAHVRNERDTEDLYEELSDRYGEPPEPVLYLLDVALLRALGERCKIISLTQEGRQVTIRPKEFDLDVWQEISDMPGVRLRVVIAEEPYLVLTMRPNDDPLAILCEIFKKYLKISGNKG